MPLWGHNCPLLALAALAPLSLAGDGPVCSRLALFSLLFCEQAWQSLSLGPFAGEVIPGSGMLSQVSSLRLPLGHSGLVLTLSNAARTSLPSHLLLVADAGVCAASPLGVTVGHVICGFKLFIYFPSHLCCPLRFQGSPQTRQWECFLVLGNFSLFICYIFSYLLLKTMGCLFWVPDVLCWHSEVFLVEFTQCSNVLLMNLLGEKVVSLSYSSAILGLPPKLLIIPMRSIGP